MLESPPPVWAQEANHPLSLTEKEAVAAHFYTQLDLLGREGGWSFWEREGWRAAYSFGIVDDHDLLAAHTNHWSLTDLIIHRRLGLAAIPFVLAGSGWESPDDPGRPGSNVDPCPSVRPIIPPYRVINTGDTIYVGFLAYHKSGIASFSYSIDGGPNVTQTALTYNPDWAGGTWAYWIAVRASDHPDQNRAITVRCDVLANDGSSATYGIVEDGDNFTYPLLLNTGPGLANFCKRMVRWCAVGGSNSNDALDLVGANRTNCTYTAATRTLSSATTNAFSGYSISTEKCRYIGIRLATGMSPGVYYIESIAGDNKSVVLSATGDSLGYAAAAPATNGTAITTSNGPRPNPASAAFKCVIDSASDQPTASISYGGSFDLATRRGDNCLVLCDAGTYYWDRDSGVSTSTCTNGFLRIARAPGVAAGDFTIAGSGGVNTGRITLCHLDMTGGSLVRTKLTGLGAGYSLWVDGAEFRGRTDVERGVDTVNPAQDVGGVSENVIRITNASGGSLTFTVTSGNLAISTGTPTNITLSAAVTIDSVITAINAVSGLTAVMLKSNGTVGTSDNTGTPSSRLYLQTAVIANGTNGNLAMNAPQNGTGLVDPAQHSLGAWATNGSWNYSESCITPTFNFVNMQVAYLGADLSSQPGLIFKVTGRTVSKTRYGHYGNHTDGVQFSPTATVSNRIISGVRLFDWAGQPLIISPSNSPIPTARNVHFVNYLFVQTTNHQYKVDLGFSAAVLQHLILAHFTLPNAHWSIGAQTGGGSYQNCLIRYVVSRYLYNSGTTPPSGLDIDYGHSYDAGQTDTSKFAHWTSGDPKFTDGAYDDDYDSNAEDYQPAADSPLHLASGSGTLIGNPDVLGTLRPQPFDIGATQNATFAGSDPFEPPPVSFGGDSRGQGWRSRFFRRSGR